jgi:predicted acyl esterase
MAAASSPAPAARRATFPRLRSVYVPMPDGVRLATDVWLPAGTTADARLPTVLETDRYWRAPAYTGGIRKNPNYHIALPWNRRGYACVFTDLRGTGASFGALTAELGGAMIADVGSLADWIAAQPWSNGRVGVTGVSEGELSLADRAVALQRDSPPWRRLSTPRSYASADAAPFPGGEPQRVTFDLLPTSVLFRAGDRIRLTIAAADPDAFQLLPANGKAAYRIGHGGAAPSYLELPVVK